MNTKARIIATVRAAINAATPKLISFQHLRTVRDEQYTDYAEHYFTVNGVELKTGLHDTEYYSFLEIPSSDVCELTIAELKLLLWWLESNANVVQQRHTAVQHFYGEGEEYRGWPGDGSGEDDFADYNQNEGNDW